MAEATRLKDILTDLKQLKETVDYKDAAGQSRLLQLEQKLDAWTQAHDPVRLDRLELSLDSIHRSLESVTRAVESISHHPSGPLNNDPPPSSALRSMKLAFPQFDGTEPLKWLFRAEQFFDLYQTPDDQRVAIASIHMTGDTIPWFQMLQRHHLIPTWPALTQVILTHFGPSPFDSPRSTLFKLLQTDSVAQYSTQFMVLANRVEGLTDDAILDCFISGLKSDVKREVIVQSPPTLVRAVALAKLFDDKTLLQAAPSRPKPFSTGVSFPKPFSPTPAATVPPLPALLPTPKTPALPQPVKRISPAEMQLRREKGLCYTCDEKFSPTHRCPNRH